MIPYPATTSNWTISICNGFMKASHSICILAALLPKAECRFQSFAIYGIRPVCPCPHETIRNDSFHSPLRLLQYRAWSYCDWLWSDMDWFSSTVFIISDVCFCRPETGGSVRIVWFLHLITSLYKALIRVPIIANSHVNNIWHSSGTIPYYYWETGVISIG